MEFSFLSGSRRVCAVCRGIGLCAAVSITMYMGTVSGAAAEPLVIPKKSDIAAGTAASDITASEMPRPAEGVTPKSLVKRLTQIAESPAEGIDVIRDTARQLLANIDNLIAAYDKQELREADAILRQLEQNLQKWEIIRKGWTIEESIDEENKPYVPSKIALKEISSSIQRRISIWGYFLRADGAEPQPVSMLYGKTTADLLRLQGRSVAVQTLCSVGKRTADKNAGQKWGEYLDIPVWMSELKSNLTPAAQAAAGPSPRGKQKTAVLPLPVLRTLAYHANQTILRLESPALTDDQAAFLLNPTILAWKEELRHWTADIGEPVKVMQAVERYEETGGMSDMRSLFRTTDALAFSATQAYQDFADKIRRTYGMPNFKAFVSESLLNNHLPQMNAETARFQEMVMENPTVGRRHANTELLITFRPHPSKIVFSIDAGLDLTTLSRTDAFASQLFNAGQALVVARKPVELTNDGFIFEPSLAKMVDHQLRLVRVDTRFDNVPLISSMFRGTVYNQYESKYADAKLATQQKIVKQVRSRIDQEIDHRFKPVNAKIKDFRKGAAEHFDLKVEVQEARTEENWLITGWGVRSKDALGSSTPAPDTLPGAFADVKVHESLFNMLVGKLEFDGKRGKVGEFKAMLAEKFRQPMLAEPTENDDVEIVFDPYNPVVIRFADGCAEILISIAELRMLRQTHRDFQVIVRYKPSMDANNQLILERDGHISLINVRAQVLMRAVFGKVFPVGKPFPLTPGMLTSRPAYNYLVVGQCRIENGWFAAALVEKEGVIQAKREKHGESMR